MPNLVVYVPAKLWKRLEDELGVEFPAWARQMTLKHMQEFLDGGALSERGGKDVSAPFEDRERAFSQPSRSESDPHFKPDFKG